VAILIEAISVVIKRSAIDDKYPGGWEAFVEDCPNQTLCADSTLARIGFMSPVDVESYVKQLEINGFVYLQNNEAKDLVVADQQRGLSANCKWVEFGHVNLDGDTSKRVASCQIVGGVDEPLLNPDGWKYEGSLSQTFAFAPTEHVDKSLQFLRHENGLDVYFNKLTGKEVYLGRTGDK
jgi:hypothetical protein